MKSYLKINLIFAGIIVALLVYSGVFHTNTSYPIHSMYKQNVISTGMSRAFSEIVRFHFDKAKAYNPYAISIFLFFFCQLFLRIISSIFLLKGKISKNNLLFADIFISILLFLYSFGRFIGDQIF